ncbi:type II toxin-antitoxin system PemK/MazF family toxin [Geminocystis sp. GBBB08]|uniref:type II toxin-antitoxin system PemK/MazF family toxin n=1 Tax=Geminocystis sp. GBBB08 TaxID=2604140 RepID=UPI0027E386CA|nr:type II toxin-antitoxin system PemK/MazF family toxin [Geminocystis sp. GBBB08]MBL1211365.1 type II toxin-antitoxin system PemK/MazF family toxin [Geminocystis sp. GBBB08]
MVTPTVGSVILIPFPFSDLSQSKLRPAIVLANAGYGDWILCQVTSKSYTDSRAIELNNQDFSNGSLKVISYARPSKLFTANSNLIVRKIGDLKPEIMEKIVSEIIDLLRTGKELDSD